MSCTIMTYSNYNYIIIIIIVIITYTYMIQYIHVQLSASYIDNSKREDDCIGEQ